MRDPADNEADYERSLERERYEDETGDARADEIWLSEQDRLCQDNEYHDWVEVTASGASRLWVCSACGGETHREVVATYPEFHRIMAGEAPREPEENVIYRRYTLEDVMGLEDRVQALEKAAEYAHGLIALHVAGVGIDRNFWRVAEAKLADVVGHLLEESDA